MVDAVANQPSKERPPSPLKQFKIADPQYYFSVDPPATIEEMENAIWQQIGGNEIISLVRRDLIDGTNPNYSIISDLQELYAQYNPKSIIRIDGSAAFFKDSFGIIFERYLPSTESLLEISENIVNPVNIEQSSEGQDIVIYVADLPDSYEVEIHSISAGEILRDTIYEGESYQS